MVAVVAALTALAWPAWVPALALGLGLAACGGGPGAGTANPPPPPVLVKGGAASYTSVVVSAGTRAVALDRGQWSAITPLLAAKSFRPDEPLSSYGLAPPVGRLVLRTRAGATTTLVVGGPTFDNHFVYVSRPGRRLVYTVPADQVRSLLALVGVVVGPPR